MIIILDFGGQSAHLIGRRLKNLGVDFAFCQPEDAHEVMREEQPTGIILSGGPASVYDDGAPEIDVSIFGMGIPILGICYGWQIMAKLLGGDVQPGNKEYGKATLHIGESVSNKHSETISLEGDGKSKMKGRGVLSLANGDSWIPKISLEGDVRRTEGVLGKGGKSWIPKIIPYGKDLKEKARKLRKSMTGPEKHIWHEVISKKGILGVRALRQVPMLDYIVDFYLPDVGIIIEIDGESHDETSYHYDKNRQKNLEKEGLIVVRYTNDDILKHTQSVMEDLERICQSRQHTPSPKSGISDPPPGGSLKSPPLDKIRKQSQICQSRGHTPSFGSTSSAPPPGGSTTSPILHGLPKSSQIWQSHGDSVSRLPDGWEKLACTNDLEFAAVSDEQRKLYGVQFHPELDHTEFGEQILKNFVQRICDLPTKEFVIDPEDIVNEIRQKIGNDRVICAVSGGVDSSVAGYLIAKAIGDKLTPVYVDSGLMRAGTTERVRYIFGELVKTDLQIIEAKERFMSALSGKDDPEEKRKIIGKLYVDIFEEVANHYEDAKFLGQGTIYSDVIESKGSKNASNIKSHHNVGGLPAHMKLQLIEPLRNLYKDEVREVGRMMGIPDEIVGQHPFPGPGYAVRIRGEVTEKRLGQCKIADAIIMEEVEKAGLMGTLFQIFPIMSGAYSTAVKGDARAFAEVIAIRAYESRDIISADWSYLPRELLATISTRLVNEVPDISRVVYDITSKPPATMEWE